MLRTYKIAIGGRVQGVGFRPFVNKLANTMGLLGYVSNNEDGVVIMVSGESDTIYHFYKDLLENPPPLARIKTQHYIEVNYCNFDSFTIVPSQTERKLNLALTPDFGICPECRVEILDPLNRRFQYAFTTCVNCGPRWSITKTFPFERDHTTITTFKMCPTCLDEYEDVGDRRFHSQTNTCPDCGIKMELTNSQLSDDISPLVIQRLTFLKCTNLNDRVGEILKSSFVIQNPDSYQVFYSKIRF